MSKDLYKVLGLQRGASDDEIKKAYRKLALQFHPDKQQGKSDGEKKEAEDRFKEINEAYSVLSDPRKKREYDQFGSVGINMDGDSFSGMADFIRNMHSTGDPFASFFNNSNGRNTEPIINGEDTRIRVECTLEDIYKGVTKTVKYTRKVKCSDCNGTGSKNGEKGTCPHCNGTGVERVTKRSAFGIQITETYCRHCNGTGRLIKDPCRKCGGTGLEETKETVQIPIPIEVRDGIIIRMDGMGNMAPNNMGNPGDLYVKFSVKPSSQFTIAQNNVDIKTSVKVNVLDCITGCDKTVPCISGAKTTVKIPLGAKNGQEVVVRGQGMPIGNGRYGDMLVRIEQVMPNCLTSDELEKINGLKTSKNFK